ncbi:hypothetical protein QA596_09435 [Balneolales bacterium ANBcel1]|nr:hypothetical protein [Balneolales bacterium ANBcel1]
MATGQTLLSIGAFVLLSIIAVNINRTHVQAVHNMVENQARTDALIVGRDLCDRIQRHSYNPAFDFNQLEAEFGNLDNVNDPGRRWSFTSPSGYTLHATFDISNERTLALGQTGRLVTVAVFLEEEGEIIPKATYVTAVLPIHESVNP